MVYPSSDGSSSSFPIKLNSLINLQIFSQFWRKLFGHTQRIVDLSLFPICSDGQIQGDKSPFVIIRLQTIHKSDG